MRVLLTGSSASGKSSIAENIAISMPSPHAYLATMRPWSDFDFERIERHRELRSGKGFSTIECYRDIDSIRFESGTILLEDLCCLVSNEMFDDDGNQIDCMGKLERELRSLVAQNENIVLVTSEVGADGCSYEQTTQDYIETLGKLNIIAASLCDTVIECVCGCPTIIKGSSDALGAVL